LRYTKPWLWRFLCPFYRLNPRKAWRVSKSETGFPRRWAGWEGTDRSVPRPTSSIRTACGTRSNSATNTRPTPSRGRRSPAAGLLFPGKRGWDNAEAILAAGKGGRTALAIGVPGDRLCQTRGQERRRRHRLALPIGPMTGRRSSLTRRSARPRTCPCSCRADAI
jgi:hypothetical protein